MAAWRRRRSVVPVHAGHKTYRPMPVTRPAGSRGDWFRWGGIGWTIERFFVRRAAAKRRIVGLGEITAGRSDGSCHCGDTRTCHWTAGVPCLPTALTLGARGARGGAMLRSCLGRSRRCASEQCQRNQRSDQFSERHSCIAGHRNCPGYLSGIPARFPFGLIIGSLVHPPRIDHPFAAGRSVCRRRRAAAPALESGVKVLDKFASRSP
jgi:hypothetical protein